MAVEPIQVFFSYSHKDEALRDELATHLAILQRQGIIAAWHDRQIGAGMEWATEIDAQMNAADIILLLVSQYFLASDYCWGVELTRAMERHEAGSACVIPIILRPVDWQGAPFGKLQAFPKDAKPITTWANQDEAFFNVEQGIRKAAEQIRKRQPQTVARRSPEDGQLIREADRGIESYRQEVIHCIQEDGVQLSPMSRIYLDGVRHSLNLSQEQANQIEQETLKPYQTYAQALAGILQQEYPLEAKTRDRLRRLQQTLNLSDGDIAALETRIFEEIAPIP